MFSRRNEDTEILVTTGGPFGRKVLVNFIKVGNSFIIIPTGSWIRDIEIFPYLQVNGEIFKVHFEEIGKYKESFISKYGDHHYNTYFSQCENAIVMEQYDGKVSYGYETIGRYFDSISGDYIEEVSSNKTQKMMRNRVMKILLKYVKDGDSVLDLGSGPDSEILHTGKKISVTEVDLSEKALELSKSFERKGQMAIKYVLMRNIDDIKGEYNVIFSTFGFLNLETTDNVKKIIDEHLKENGYFIGSYMNKFGITDLVIALILGRGDYIREKVSGYLSPNYSRYGLISYPRGPDFLARIGIKTILMKKGIGSVLPPYNYKRLNNFIEKFIPVYRIDEILSSFPMMWAYSDFVIFIGKKVLS